MNNIKEPLKLGAILGVIALCIAMLLSFINSITKDKIKAANELEIQKGLMEVMAEADHFVPMDGIDAANGQNITVSNMFLAMDKDENVIGYCATVLPKGYGGEIETIVGVDMEGTVTGVKVTNNMSETAGLGAKATVKENYTYQFEGKKPQFAVKKDGGEIDAITSATITSRAVANGVNAACEVMQKNGIYGESGEELGEMVEGKYVMPAVEPKPEENTEEKPEGNSQSEEAGVNE